MEARGSLWMIGLLIGLGCVRQVEGRDIGNKGVRTEIVFAHCRLRVQLFRTDVLTFRFSFVDIINRNSIDVFVFFNVITVFTFYFFFSITVDF